MIKKIKHKWEEYTGWRTHKCLRCNAIRKYDNSFGKYYIYYDKFGKLFTHHAPECVLPNTLIK
jgi:hypothetical protein